MPTHDLCLRQRLLVGQVLAVNPAHASKYVVHCIKTPVLIEEQTRRLPKRLDKCRPLSVCATRTDRHRIGSVVATRVEGYYPEGMRWWVRLREEGQEPRDASAPQA